MGELLFGFDGRIGRGTFWAVQIPVFLLSWLYLTYVDHLLALWIPGSIFMGSAVALVIAAPLIWIQYAIAIKRCHDRGKSGFWSLLLLLPPLGLIWLIIDCGVLPAATAPVRLWPRNEP